MHYFISAGEASGDLHASELMAALKEQDHDARFTFLGGDLMAAAGGGKPLIHIRDMAFMGFVDVAMHLTTVLGNLAKARRALRESKPDALIVVDYPSFNLKLVAEAQKLGIPVFGYISPKVWAWKEGRIKKMKRGLRHLFSILPFEPEYFAKHDFTNVTYVGNPSREEIDRKITNLPSREKFLAAHGLSESKPLLALVPGSRVGEIRSNLPIMRDVALRHPQMQAIIAAAPAIDAKLYQSIAPQFKVVENSTFELMHFSEAALVTSGTATLECALLATPQVACYRANGSRLAYNLFKRILKIPFVTLPNLISGREIIPEMLVHLCTVDRVDDKLSPLLSDTPERRLMLNDYAEMRRMLGENPAASTTAKLIAENL